MVPRGGAANRMASKAGRPGLKEAVRLESALIRYMFGKDNCSCGIADKLEGREQTKQTIQESMGDTLQQCSGGRGRALKDVECQQTSPTHSCLSLHTATWQITDC